MASSIETLKAHVAEIDRLHAILRRINGHIGIEPTDPTLIAIREEIQGPDGPWPEDQAGWEGDLRAAEKVREDLILALEAKHQLEAKVAELRSDLLYMAEQWFKSLKELADG